MDISNKSILITGGASGIGREAARQFSELGLNVFVCGRSEEKLRSLKKELPQVQTIRCDLTLERDRTELVQQVLLLGGIDILYNNAAVIEVIDLSSKGRSIYESAKFEMETNYLSVVDLIEKFLPSLESKSEAAIINTTSVVAMVPAAVIPSYSATKAALRSYTQSLRAHLKRSKSKVEVFELIPPLVDTDVVKKFDGSKMKPEKLIKELIGSLRSGTSEIYAGPAKMLARMTRLAPDFVFGMLNNKKSFEPLEKK
jgi:short-subunit dehydrogenase involved in D-alanine esterification of teichoic acids